MMTWHFVTSAEFAAGNKVDGDMYFLSDTHEIYRGTQNYTRSVVMYDTTLPNPAAKNTLYIDKTTLAGYMTEDGTAWTQVVLPVVDTVTSDGKNPVSGAAVVAYVAAEMAKVASSADTVKDVSYDGVEHLLTVSKANDASSTIVLSGLGCSLSFASNELQLLDASGNKIGDPVNMDVERFVQSGEYDADTKNIILYFDAEKTDKVEIPVGDLVDTYEVESTNAINLTMVANKITAALTLSSDEGNAAEIRENGLYVPTVNTSDLIPKVLGGTAGNIPAIAEDGTLIDSGVAADGIGTHTVYQVSSEDDRIALDDMKEGDFCIVSTMFFDGDTDRISRTAYVYTNSTWVAFDGNVNAENVYFSTDLTTNYAIGKITLTNGQANISAAGQNLNGVWKNIFQQYKAPVTTQPSVSVSAPKAAVVEVGSTYTPSYAATLNGGSYTYDTSGTGVTATAWSVTDTAGHTATTNTGSFDSFVVTDNTSYSVTATATYGDGIIPHANDGSEYPAGQIKAGTKSGTSGVVKGYRAAFYGSHTTKDDIDSAMVRALTGKSTAALANGSSFKFQVPVGAMRIVIAYPATIRDMTLCKNESNNFDEKSAFTMHTIDVEGANGYDAASYKVYVLDRAEAVSAAFTYAVTL